MQQITPDILKWIVALADAGHKPETVMKAMQRSGWHEYEARTAIEEAKRGFLNAILEPVPVPEPNLVDSPWTVKTSDRDVTVLFATTLPRVIVFGGLLSHAECDELIELSHGRLQRSQINDNWSGGGEVSETRTSQGTFFDPGETPILQRVEARIAELLRWPIERGEGMQILRYAPGNEYQPHHDYFDPTVPGNERVLSEGGQRVGTLITYLSSPTRGGGTTFPDVGLEVAPIKGNAVFFSYSSPHPSTRTLHAGAPVIDGVKWVATKWLRERALRCS